jgi:hypothetical protein
MEERTPTEKQPSKMVNRVYLTIFIEIDEEMLKEMCAFSNLSSNSA